jgi:NADH-quinone oxidoreductase subunit G
VINGRFTRLSSHATHNLQVAAGDIVSTVRQLVSMAKVETDGSSPLDAAAETLITANNLVAFYGYEGLSYEETKSLAKALANLLLIQTDGEPHVGRVNNGLIPVWPYANTQGAWDMGIHPAFLPSYKEAKTVGLDAAAMFAAASSGEVNALFVVGADPIGDGWMADRGKLDLLIVQELFMTKTAVSADIVFPAQSWAERDGTFTNGERRVQRYYPAIRPVGDSRPDWQILSQLGERVGADKAETVASLVFKKLTRAARQYKGMDYRSLGQVEAQWPVVGGEDRYYGGNAFANTAGLGRQWEVVAESKAVKQFEIDEATTPRGDGLLLINAVKLYTHGTLIDKSNVLAPRMAKPTLTINPADAGSYAAGDMLMVRTDRMSVQATAVVSDDVMAGTAVLHGVKAMAGTAVARLSKIKE